jgi:SAM-dependent methyltransferase
VSGPVSFDPVADRYDQTRGGPRAGEFATAIRGWLEPGPVAEVGVGTGLVAAALATPANPVIGFDISAGMLVRAYRRIGARVAVADARRLPVRDGAVSAVVFSMVLHVVGDIPATLAEAARVVRPGGRIVAVHSRPDHEANDMDPVLRGLEARRHQRPDHDDALGAAADRAGLSPLHQGWTGRYPVRQSPNGVADGIEDRVWSYLWPIEDDVWRRDVEPAIRALRELPEPDRPRHYSARHRLTVFARR